MSKLNRAHYACEDMLKQGYTKELQTFGKSIYVFLSEKERNEFLSDKDQKSFFKITQKEAYRVANLNLKNSVPCVYKNSINHSLNMLGDIRQCKGSIYQLITEFKG